MAHVAPKQGAPEPVCRVDATKSSHDLTVAKAQIQLLHQYKKASGHELLLYSLSQGSGCQNKAFEFDLFESQQ